MNVAAKDDQVLVLERRFRASPERVFDAWVKPEQIAEWFGPEGMTVPAHAIDPQVGGKWQVTMRGPDGQDRVVSGVYRVIDRPSRLVFTWAWHNDGKRGHETEVALDFVADGEGTIIKLRQQSFETANDRDMHNMGWSSSFNDLARVVEA